MGTLGLRPDQAQQGIVAQEVEWTEVWSQTPGTTGQQVSVLEPHLAQLRRGLTTLAILWARHMFPMPGG